jgi:aerobic carbon-monoxide dehydrogenase large subunit
MAERLSNRAGMPLPGRIGDSIARVEDFRLLTGAGRYTNDLNEPNALHAVFVRSLHAHALIRLINTSAALARPGVTVLTGDALAAAGVGALPNPTPDLGPGYAAFDGVVRSNPPWYPLARGKVRHVGEAIAIVIAPSFSEASSACDEVIVDYEPLPSITDVAAADTPDAPRVWEDIPDNLLCHNKAGDLGETDAAFARAAHVIEAEVVNNRLVVNFMEPRSCVASYESESGRIALRVGSQGVHRQAESIAVCLGVPRDLVRVITEDVGGGFGARTTAYPEYAACAYAAFALRRSVRWLGSRSEAFLSDTQARDHLSRGALALDQDGRILGLKVTARCNMGAHVGARQPISTTANIVRMLCGAYAIPTAHLELKVFVTNTVPINVYRGVGRLEAQYLIERLLDRAASVIGMDRAELRRRNLVPSKAMPWRTPTDSIYDCGDFVGLLEMALAEADWKNFESRRAESQTRDKLRGIGVASIIEGAGGTAQEYAAVEAKSDGTLQIAVGAQSQGQGHETSFAQVAADLFDLPFAAIRFISGDTDRVAAGGGTFASRSMIKAGGATVEAGRALLEQARQRASEALEAPMADLAYAAGRFTVAGTDLSVTLSELAATAPLVAEAHHHNDLVAWPNGAHVCEVEVDPETGFVELTRYVAVDDVGRAVNPAIVHGQTMGAVAQGLGQALFERCVYDPDSGQLLTGSFMDYAVPRAGDLPSIETSLKGIPTSNNALGVKGAGEAGTVAAPCAAINAVLDALAPLGVVHIDMPATPERVWAAIQAVRCALS